MQPKHEIISLLVNLIREQMQLDVNHVVTYNQRIPIPPDDTIFVAVGLLGDKPYGHKISYEQGYIPASQVGQPETVVLNEVQTQNVQQIYSIQIMSRNNDARARRQEILFALNSTRAEQLQEKYGFKIGNIPTSFNDASYVEGASRLTRYAITFNVLTAFIRIIPVNYYDDFAGSPELITQP